MFCKHCGKEVNDKAVVCINCGCSLTGTNPGTSINIENASPYSKMTALLLCIFLGGLGIHNFYVGKPLIGVLQILTLGGCGIWALVDLILIATGSFEDGQGRKLLV